ncbi:RNA polymerase subunit sigma-24, partial [cyanobacterium TDX16]
PRTGLPPSPRGWLVVTAKNRALDLLRREAKRGPKEQEALAVLSRPEPDRPSESVLRDDLLRLVFTCCHPSLSPDVQVALALRTLCGLTTPEVARALLVSEATMAKRLTRARQKIARAAIPYRVPNDAELPDRLSAVAATVYLVFNEGYAASAGAEHLRTELATDAIRLGRLLHELLPDEPQVHGLLALMLLQHARRETRLDEVGELVLLADQDRSRWDLEAIHEGVVLVGEGLRRTPEHPDPYVVQAAIAACHGLALTPEETDWGAITSWYEVLLTVLDTPVVRLNHAVAVGERDGPAAGLVLVDGIEGLVAYPLWHASRAELLARLGRADEARTAWREAASLPISEAQRAFLLRRAERAG